MSWDDMSDSVCDVARALSVVGERWTLLIMREVGIGVRRFEDIQAQLSISSHLLADRLKRLEAAGVLERRPYCKRPLRFEYFATKKGKELDGVLLALRAWGIRWCRTSPSPAPAFSITPRGKIKGGNSGSMGGVDAKPFTFDDVDAVMSDAFKAERAARSAAFELKTAKRRAPNADVNGRGRSGRKKG